MYGLVWSFLVICVGTAFAVVDTSGTDRYATSNLFSPEGKDFMNKVQNYLDELEKKIEDLIKQLKEENTALDALEKYRATYKASTNPECTTEPLDVYKTCEENIKSFVDKCDNALPLDSLAEFYSEIELAKGKVKAVDNELNKNAAICSSFPDLCAEVKKSLTDELDKVLSPDEKIKFSLASSNVYMNIKKNLETCFDAKSKDLRNELAEKGRQISDCINNIK